MINHSLVIQVVNKHCENTHFPIRYQNLHTFVFFPWDLIFFFFKTQLCLTHVTVCDKQPLHSIIKNGGQIIKDYKNLYYLRDSAIGFQQKSFICFQGQHVKIHKLYSGKEKKKRFNPRPSVLLDILKSQTQLDEQSFTDVHYSCCCVQMHDKGICSQAVQETKIPAADLDLWACLKDSFAFVLIW